MAASRRRRRLAAEEEVGLPNGGGESPSLSSREGIGTERLLPRIKLAAGLASRAAAPSGGRPDRSQGLRGGGMGRRDTPLFLQFLTATMRASNRLGAAHQHLEGCPAFLTMIFVNGHGGTMFFGVALLLGLS